MDMPRMRLPNPAHTPRPWRIHELTSGFQLEDVWALPTPGGPDDFPRLVRLIASGSPARGSSRAALPVPWRGLLFAYAAGTAVAAALARRSPGRPGPGRVPAASGRAAAVTVPGQPLHRPGGTVVPRAATEDSTSKPTIE
jgi:hypothetical protein